MSNEDVNTPAILPPPEITDPNKKAVWVPERINKFGTVLPAHWRVILRHRKPALERNRAIRERALKPKRGPKPGKPRMTGLPHVQHILDQLSVPLAYFVGVQSVHPVDMINRCIVAIEDAQLLLARFTKGGNDADVHEEGH